MTASFDYSNSNFTVPTIQSAPVSTNTPSSVALYGTSPTIANPAYSQSAADAANAALANWQSNGGVDGNGNPTAAPAAYSVPQTIQGPVAQAPTMTQLNTTLPTNPGLQTISPQYNTTSPQQSSFYWGTQGAGSGTQSQPTQQAPAVAWGTGNGDANATNSFDVDAFMTKMLSPQMQAAAQGSSLASLKPTH